MGIALLADVNIEGPPIGCAHAPGLCLAYASDMQPSNGVGGK